MNLKFCFSGWVSGDVKEAISAEGLTVQLDTLPKKEVLKKLNTGELSISLKDCLNQSDEDIEIFDFE